MIFGKTPEERFCILTKKFNKRRAKLNFDYKRYIQKIKSSKNQERLKLLYEKKIFKKFAWYPIKLSEYDGRIAWLQHVYKYYDIFIYKCDVDEYFMMNGYHYSISNRQIEGVK